MSSNAAPVQRAAGTVLWRKHKGRLLVALIHRRRYDDWSWPKGKLDADEDWPVAAAREAFEETGLTVRLGPPLPDSAYPLSDSPGRATRKLVRYWSAMPTGGDGRLRHEVDKVVWLPIDKAAKRLSYDRDQDQLKALVAADHDHRLRTWPLVIVRHAKAVPRKQWSKADWRRPLDERGVVQAQALTPMLEAYGVARVVTSSATRCIVTVKPYARHISTKVHSTAILSEEGFEEEPAAVTRWLRKALRHGEPMAVCTHGPILPHLFDRLAELPEAELPADAPRPRATLQQASAENLDKGEILVAHLAGTGKAVKVVAVERHPPLL